MNKYLPLSFQLQQALAAVLVLQPLLEAHLQPSNLPEVLELPLEVLEQLQLQLEECLELLKRLKVKDSVLELPQRTQLEALLVPLAAHLANNSNRLMEQP